MLMCIFIFRFKVTLLIFDTIITVSVVVLY